MKLTAIGYGNVGRTLGLGLAARGHQVAFGVRDVTKGEVFDFAHANPGVAVLPLDAAIASAEVVLLAVPYPAALDLGRRPESLAGKIVVDCTNPIGPGPSLSVGLTTSGAEEIAKVLPAARVVKAFNTTGWENMADANYPGMGGVLPLMPVCGDHPDANAIVCGLAADLGFEPWDWGPLTGARYLEPLAMLWIIPARARGMGPDFAFALLKR